MATAKNRDYEVIRIDSEYPPYGEPSYEIHWIYPFKFCRPFCEPSLQEILDTVKIEWPEASLNSICIHEEEGKIVVKIRGH